MRGLYWLFAHLGLMGVVASFIAGFRHDPSAPTMNYVYDALLYGATSRSLRDDASLGQAYASVRHPMYRGFVFAGLSSLLVHANMAQLFWVIVVGASLILFIPFEERELLAARGDEYRAYMQLTRYRLIRGIW